jgi:predicted nucleic acid-binding protein
VIVDTSAFLAYFNAREPAHQEVAEILEGARSPLRYSPLVLAELDYMVLSRRGVAAERAVLQELQKPPWRLVVLNDNDIYDATQLISKYADTPIGLTDAVNMVLAERYETWEIATLDRRHYSFLTTMSGRSLAVLPSQANFQ